MQIGNDMKSSDTKKKVFAFSTNKRCSNSSGRHSSCHCCHWHIYHWPILFVSLCFCAHALVRLSAAAPSIESEPNGWSPMPHYDIWNTNAEETAAPTAADADADGDVDDEYEQQFLTDSFTLNGIELQDNFEYLKNLTAPVHETQKGAYRQSKVIHLFPVPVDGECLSDDGRRLGNCFNAYECRQKGGTAKGECAMGFGVCCVFIANCNATITNNITYLVSPNFPSFMPSNFSACNLKVKPMSGDISQLRIDFYHFSLSQPNRRTGVCDGDVFTISGGPSGKFSLCGQNSGQHMYYDVGGRALPRQSTLYGSIRPLTYAQLYPNQNVTGNGTNVVDQLIDISLNFTNRFLPIRLWEIRIAQIPFSQRAPAGCLQYHTGREGVMQTFNFADNGRHLANQHYRICVRQETEMCSIMYQPCDEQSFRIGSSNAMMMSAMRPSGMPTGGGGGGGGVSGSTNLSSASSSALSGITATTPMMASMNTNSSSSSSTTTTTTATPTTTNATTTTTTTSTTTTTATPTTTTARASTTNATTAQPTSSSSAASTAASTASSPLSDDVEGSGNDYDDWQAVTPAPQAGVSRRPRPINIGGGSSGGFDLLGFLRSAFDLRVRRSRRRRRSTDRAGRQFYSSCTDRITMPCIIEDFIGTGFGPLPGCEPVHCGAQFCSSGAWPCRIESTVTPFYIGVHFGDGAGKGSAEDNIGACLRYTQVQCM